MRGKFADVHVEPDTRIIESREVEVDGIPALYQSWKWEDLYGNSLIFTSEDVQSRSDEELKRTTAEAFNQSGTMNMTVKRGERFTFVNFGFYSFDD